MMDNLCDNYAEIEAETAKRVYCLYRVSTKGQVEDNDIPMQKQRCREFAAAHGWDITKELSEKGVSGFKRSADEREAIIEIREAAARKAFDVLLVFMFDRLGRREYETTALVKELTTYGIEVWSTVEGQMRFDSHTDDLINFLAFWTAQGESIKTRTRTRTRLEQIVQEGRFRGGICPYGYKLVKRGRINKRNHEVYEIEIDEEEAKIVRLIFDKYVLEGFGAQRLARYLTEQGIHNRKGKNFVNTSLNNILKNIMYMGILRNGAAQSEIFPELQIITPEQFRKAHEIMQSRANNDSRVPLSTKGTALLTGLIYCGGCGTKLVLTSSSGGSRTGQKRPIKLVYQCHHHVRHPDECDNQYNFIVDIVDGIVLTAVRTMFSRMGKVSTAKIIQRQYDFETKTAEAEVARLTAEREKLQKQLDIYKEEIGKSLLGESRWDADLLRDLTNDVRSKLADTETQLEAATDALNDTKRRYAEIVKRHEEMKSWAELFNTCSTEAKKMILSKLIEKVVIKSGYELEICWRISYMQFCGIGEDNNSTKIKTEQP